MKFLDVTKNNRYSAKFDSYNCFSSVETLVMAMSSYVSVAGDRPGDSCYFCIRLCLQTDWRARQLALQVAEKPDLEADSSLPSADEVTSIWYFARTNQYIRAGVAQCV